MANQYNKESQRLQEQVQKLKKNVEDYIDEQFKLQQQIPQFEKELQ